MEPVEPVKPVPVSVGNAVAESVPVLVPKSGSKALLEALPGALLEAAASVGVALWAATVLPTAEL